MATGVVSSVEFSPDGKKLASGSADNTVRLWDVASGKEIRRMEGHSASVNSVVFSPDGQYVYVGNFLGRNVSILRVEGESVVDTGKTIELDAGPAAMRGSR